MIRIDRSRIFLGIVSLVLIISFIGFIASAASNEKRVQLPDGPDHSNKLTHLEKTVNSNAIYSSALAISASKKILIVTSGHGPLTGISPIAEKDYWISIIQNMGLGTPDWYDGSPSITLLNQYDLVIYDAGGYWYPLSYEVSSLWDYHFAGKPLIVVAPDLNYDWSNIKGTSRPSFPEDVLHIEGVLGILPEASFEVIANTGHEIIKSIPTNQHIPVASQSSWPDAFDARSDGQGVLTQGYISLTEFGVGISSGLPSGSPYDPQGTLFSVAAYRGSTNEGRTITFGFPPTALQDSNILDTLAKSTISWALGAKKIPITLNIEDAQNHVKVNKAPGDIIDIVEQIENQESSQENVDARLEIPSDLFGNPIKVFIRDSFTDTSETDQFWTKPATGVYYVSINLPSNTKKQIVWRFRIPETFSAQDNFKLTGKTYTNNLMTSSDYGLIKIASSTEAIIVTNRKLLFDKFGLNSQSNKDDVQSLLSYLFEISDSNSAGEKNSIVYYVDRYSTLAYNWNQNVDYSNTEYIANTVANDIDALIETKYAKLSSQPQYLLIVGGDEIIPFYRVNNAGYSSTEENYNSDDPVMDILDHNYYPTDNVYADMDDQYNEGDVELAAGRISSSSARIMQNFILNGILGPTSSNNAIIFSDTRNDVDSVVDKLIKKQFNILNDNENPHSIESDSWHIYDLLTAMNRGFRVFSHASHANYNQLCNDIGECMYPSDIFDANGISNNRPFITTAGCLPGLITDSGGASWSPASADNIVWAFARQGASGILASPSTVNINPSNGNDWLEKGDGIAYGERLYNQYFEYLITEGSTTRPVGEALKLADINYDVGWDGTDGKDRKSRIQYVLYGVPWMTMDPPITDPKLSEPSAIAQYSSSPAQTSLNTYTKTVNINVSDYNISQIEGYDLVSISGAQMIYSDYKPILPKTNVNINLPLNSNLKDVKIIQSAQTSLGSLNIPNFKSISANDPPTSGFINETDVIGLYPNPRFVVHTSKLKDYIIVNIGISPIQFDPQTRDTTLFNKTVLEITYETSNPVVITELTTDKPAYSSGETVDTNTSIENIGAEAITGMHLELILKDMVGQILASVSSESFDLPVGTSKINKVISTSGLPQGSYVLEVTAFDNTNTPRASTSTFIYTSSGRISNFVITPDTATQGDDVTFEFTFENFEPISVEANGSVHIYNEAGVEVANLPMAPVTIDASSAKTINVTWNTLGKESGDYTALSTISVANNVFGPLFGLFKILPSDSITVVSPNGGENWLRGGTRTIRWNYTGSSGSFVNITLLKAGVFNRTINASVPIGSGGSGSYNWLIDLNQTLGTDYKIKITSTTNPAYTDTSDNNFNISTQTVNLIKNPGFENGTVNWWFYTNGTGNFMVISPGYEGTKAAQINLSSNGTSIQLYQMNVTLEPKSIYRLSFAAYSTTGNDLLVWLYQHDKPYKDYGLNQFFDLGTSWQTFSTVFTAANLTNTVNDGRLIFWLAPFGAAGDKYYIDDVILEKIGVDNSSPMVIGNTPTGANVPVNTQITITFNETMNQYYTQSAFSTFPNTSGSFSWSGNTMIYSPYPNLAYDTSYNVTVGTGARDSAGNNLPSAYSWQFRTILPEPISNCTTISSPGAYALNTDIMNQSGTCINITSGNVFFDGTGHTIDGIDAANTHGIYVYNSIATITDITIYNLTLTDWSNGIYYKNAANGSIINNIMNSNSIGVFLDSSRNNTIYNNYFNNTNNLIFSGTIYNNTWNITKKPFTNIIGGPNLGGNFWANQSGKGFSQTCPDIDRDGICDSKYSFNSNNSDYLPLTYKPPQTGIKVVSPNGGENWRRGTTPPIIWDPINKPCAYVKIELLKPGKPNQLIVASTLNDGSHPWLIPPTQPPGNDYIVRITCPTNPIITDTSDNYFTIMTPSITVVSPNGGENWTRGTTKIINWTSTESPGSYVKIELLKPGKPNQVIISSTLNDGSHPWLIPTAQLPGSDYKVKITSTINVSNNDISDGNFTIPVPSFKLVSPNGGENWTRGTTQTIRWNSTESLGTYVKIELLKPGKPNQLIVSATLNDGSHPWLIPPAQAPGSDYKVKITSTINASNYDISDNYFTIPAPSLTVISPNGGENWTRGTTQTIRWNSTESPGTYVKIELLKPGKPNQLIVSATLNDGSHPWLIPAAQTPGTDYKVKITSTINVLNNDTSDGHLTIPVPSLTVVSPNGGENWTRGAIQTIRWNSTESQGTYVRIELLKPGKPNQLIIAATLNDGSHPWLIPPAQAPGSDYKVKITSTINVSNNDTSDDNFIIPVPSFKLVSPNEGENWTRGTTQTIRWNSTENPKSYVKIELLRPGKPNQLIIAATLNDGSHPWLIPPAQAPGSDYKVKITSTINVSNNDTSDGNFTIPVPSFTVVSPNGGENWRRGTTQTIKWTSTENPLSYVKIELLKPGKPNQLIVSATLNDDSHPCMIPSLQVPGNDYKVKITSTSNLIYTDMSDNNYTINI